MKGHERDPALDAAWRAQSTELPPPSVDAAILAAAHREVASRPHAAGDDTLAEAREPSRWWWGLAAAATIGAIAFGVVQLAPFGTAHDPTRATDMPSTESSARPAVVPAPVIADEKARTKTQIGSTVPATKAEPASAPPPVGPRQRAEAPAPASAERDAPPPSQTPRPFPMAAPPVPAAPPASSPAAKLQDAAPAAAAPAPIAERAAEVTSKRAAPSADAASAAAGLNGESRLAALRTPESFVLRIRELHEAGRLDEAARELVAFRNAYPDADAKLPPTLRAWAATVRP